MVELDRISPFPARQEEAPCDRRDASRSAEEVKVLSAISELLFGEKFKAQLTRSVVLDDDRYYASRERRRRRDWIHDRLWWNGSHRDCCPRCFQAGFVVALVETGRTDLILKYPELAQVYDELIDMRAGQPAQR